MPTVYPTLIGLGYSVIKRPIFMTDGAKASSGREVRVAYADVPMWEWELTYEYLPDKQANGSSASDLKNLLGFYLSTYGDLMPFLFKDPDDNTVTAQSLGTTDGSSTNYTLVRTYGLGSNTGTEPIGQADLSQPLHVYLDGVLQDPSTYTINTSPLVANTVQFHSTPAAGKAITITFSYYYAVKMKDKMNDFEKFMDQLWRVGKVTLSSVRN